MDTYSKSRETTFRSSVGGFLAAILRFAHPRLGSTIVLIALGAMLDGAGIVLIVPLLGVISTSAPHGELQALAAQLFAATGAHARLTQLGLLLGLFAILMLVRAAVVLARDVRLSELQIGFVEEQRGRVMNRLANARWDQLGSLRHARITDLMSGDIQRIGLAVQVLLQSGVSLVMLIVQTGIAIALSPALALIVIGFLIAGGVGLAGAMKNARIFGGFVTRANLALLDTTTQFLGGLKLAVSQNLQTSFVREFQDTLGKLRERQLGFIRQRTRSRLAVATLVALVGAVAVFVGIGILDTPSQIVIVILLVLARMNAPAMQLLQGAQQFANSLPAYEKIVELESELQPADEPKSAAVLPQLTGSIVFRDVSFRYANGGGVNAIKLTIEPENLIGIAGESGSGKSTFADLLVGLIPPQRGEIKIGETALRGAALQAWRAQVSYVSQDPFLFHDTIRRNLEWANPSANESEMWHALDIAGAGTVVRAMRAGLETIAGERGTLISGGERQRIALARALLRNPALLILDEATNAVDLESERKILERIRQAYPQMTIVMIAHRAESLFLCDRILRMEDGRLLEDHGETKRSRGAIS